MDLVAVDRPRDRMRARPAAGARTGGQKKDRDRRGAQGFIHAGANVASRVVAVEQPAEAAEDGAFLASVAARARGGGDNAVGHSAEGEGLEPDAAGPPQGGEKEAFAAEEGGLDLADVLDVEIDLGLEGDDAAGVDPQEFAGAEFALVDRAAGVEKRPAITLQSFHDKALAAEEADADLAVEGDAHAHAAGRAQEGVLLGQDL